MQRVEVRNLLLVVRIPDGHEANHYARDRAGVEEGMAQLDDQVRTAATDSVQQDGYNDKNMYETFGPAIVHRRYRQRLTESGQRDVATDHEHRVQVELQLRVVHVEALPVVDRPEDGQHRGGDQQDRGDDHDQYVLEPCATVPDAIVIVVVSPVEIESKQGRLGMACGTILRAAGN